MAVDYPAPARHNRIDRRFLWVTLAALLGAMLTASLGVWQLDRAAQKIALQERIDSRPKLPRLDNRAFTATGDPADDLLYRSVTLRGTWMARHTVFLDNRQMYGRPGFFVVTPLRLDGSDRVVLVQRGWVQRDFLDRAHVPAVATPNAFVEVSGRIAPAPAKLYDFGGAETGPIRQNLDPLRYAQEIGMPLARDSVQQLGGVADDGLARDWPAVDTGVSKHYGYAFQWFALCGLIVALYVWFQIVRRFFFPAR